MEDFQTVIMSSKPFTSDEKLERMYKWVIHHNRHKSE